MSLFVQICLSVNHFFLAGLVSRKLLRLFNALWIACFNISMSIRTNFYSHGLHNFQKGLEVFLKNGNGDVT